MEGEAAPAASAGPDGAFGRLIGAFASPVRTFRAIAARPTFLAPILLWTALSFLVSELVLSRTDWRSVLIEGAAHREQTLTDAQIERAVEGSRRFSWVFEMIAVAAPTGVAVVTAGALWMACQAFGWELGFRQALGVAAHAFLPSILASMALLVVLWGRSTIDPQGIDDVLRTSPAFLVNRRSDRTLHSLLASLDVLSFWSIGLLVLGLSAAAKTSRGKMAALVFSLWGLYVLGKAGLGIAFS